MSRPKGIPQSLKHPRTCGRPEPRRSNRQPDHHHHWASNPYDPATSPTLQRLPAALAAIDNAALCRDSGNPRGAQTK